MSDNDTSTPCAAEVAVLAHLNRVRARAAEQAVLARLDRARTEAAAGEAARSK